MAMRMLIVILVVIASVVPSQAGDLISELRGGIVAQGWGGQGVDKEQGAALNGEVVFQSPDFLSIILSPRPVIGATIAFDSDATSQVYAGLDWRFDLTDRFYVNGGAGGAIHNGETDPFDPSIDTGRQNHTVFLGCRTLFRLTAEAGFQLTDRLSASAYWAHLSSANLCTPNEGLDNLGLRLGWAF